MRGKFNMQTLRGTDYLNSFNKQAQAYAQLIAPFQNEIAAFQNMKSAVSRAGLDMFADHGLRAFDELAANTIASALFTLEEAREFSKHVDALNPGEQQEFLRELVFDEDVFDICAVIDAMQNPDSEKAKCAVEG